MTEDLLREQRAAAVRDLVELRVRPEHASAALARFGWDSDEDLYMFTRADALRVLDRYLRCQMTDDECRVWAEAVEGREDVGLELGHEVQLREFVFSLASPALTEPLTPDVAMRWRRLLGDETERS